MRKMLGHVSAGCAGALIGVAAMGMVTPAIAEDDGPQRFGHIVAERVDIVEPDGTLRQMLYSKSRDPGIMVRGQSYRHPSRTQSGMLFYNDEGTEVGGLVYAGEERENGEGESGGSLTFYAYEQDQIVQVIGVQDGSRKMAGLIVSDRPEERMDFPLIESLGLPMSDEERASVIERANLGGAARGFFGRAWNGDSTLELRDREGRVRFAVTVAEDGAAELVFRDEKGTVVRKITAEK